MEYPKLEELNCTTCQEKYIKKHFQDFHNYIILNYPNGIWLEKLYMYYNGTNNIHICPTCGKPTKFKGLWKGYQKFCCSKCAQNNINTKLLKDKTCYERYGYTNPSSNELVKQKKSKTTFEKYGVDNPFKSNEIKEKIKKINLERYGYENPIHNKSIKNKIKNTNILRYGYDYNKDLKLKREKLPDDVLEYFYRNGDRYYTIKCPHPECDKCLYKTCELKSTIYHVRKNAGIELCTNLKPVDSIYSDMEIKIIQLLDEYNIEYIRNDRTILSGKEIDIYIPSHKLAIECNGVYWHSDKYKDKNYHINKYNQCKSNGIMLVQIWEDWLRNKPEIVKSILLNKLGLLDNTIYARKCIIKEVGSKESNIFLDNNHIQGRSAAGVKLGLYYNDELVSLMTFSSPRINMGAKQHKQQWELVRFCSKLNTRVVGGASKLFNYFIKTYNPISMVSFSMNDISNGNLYDKLGFVKECENISYWYIEPHTNKRYHRTSFSKQMIIKKGWKDNKEGWTEHEVMEEKGYYRIYDAGQTKWIKLF